MDKSVSPPKLSSNEATKDNAPSAASGPPATPAITKTHSEASGNSSIQSGATSIATPAAPAEADKGHPPLSNQTQSIASAQPPATIPKVVPPTPGSPTAQKSHDTLGIGESSGRRGAEILAAMRAELLKTPIATRLANPAARILVRFMINTFAKGNIASINFLAVRTESFRAIITEAIRDIPKPVIVEVAAGFSPRGIQLATNLPNAEIIEVDLPEVIREKRARLKKLDIPDNFSWREADLGVTPLTQVLGGRQVDVISAEGLLPYFSHDDHVKIGSAFLKSLVSGGLFVTDYSWEQGFNMSKQGTSFFAKQAGKVLGIVKTQDEPKTILKRAGFVNIEVLLPEDLADRYNLQKPVSNNQLIVVARKPSKASSE